MSIEQVDVAIRIAAATILLLLGVGVFARCQDRSRFSPQYLFLPMAICVSMFVLRNTPFTDLRLSGTAADIANLTRPFTLVLIWWFCLSCFESNFRPRGIVAWITGSWLAFQLCALMPAICPFPPTFVSGALFTLGYAIVAHLSYRLLSMRPGDLVEQRRDGRLRVVLLLGGQIFIDLSFSLIFGLTRFPLPLTMTQNTAFLLFGIWLSNRLMDVRIEELSFGQRLPRPALKSVETDPNIAATTAIRERLRSLIEVDRVYLDPDLTFDKFVAQMRAPEKSVRRLVNHDLGFDHFRTFLNHYRLAEVRRRLADPQLAQDKILAIAFDCGFASVQTFNRIFRETENCTPGDYRRQAMERQAPDRPGLTPAQHASARKSER